MQLNAYLNFGGNCEEAFRFCEKNLPGKINAMMGIWSIVDDSSSAPMPS